MLNDVFMIWYEGTKMTDFGTLFNFWTILQYLDNSASAEVFPLTFGAQAWAKVKRSERNT